MKTVQAFAADTLDISEVPFDAVWTWLGHGWRDMWRVPHISLTYGAVFTAVSLLILVGLYFAGGVALILPLAGGFLLLGPMIAVGLYETSRRLEAGEPMTFGDIVTVGMKSPGQLAFLGAVMLIVYFAWLGIALLLFMLFLGSQPLALENIVPNLLFTWNGLGFLIVGTTIGAVFALFVFSATVVSIPLLMRREVDVVTAALTSIEAVARNPVPMAIWAILIAGMMVLAFVTLFLGMVIVFPLVGHATWHVYKSLVVSAPQSASPEQ